MTPLWRPATARGSVGIATVACAALAVALGSLPFDPRATPAGGAASAEFELRARLTQAAERYGESSVEVADTLVQLAGELQSGPDRNLVEARQLASRALSLHESRGGPDDDGVAAALELLALICWKQGDYVAERPFIERALRTRERASPQNERWIAKDLHFLSDLRRVEGDLAGALAIRERLGPILTRLYGPESEEAAVHFARMANLQEAIGDYRRALDNAKRAVNVRRKLEGPQDPKLAATLNDLGSLLVAVHDTQGAERVFRRALAISESQSAPEPAAVARAVEHLGEVLVEHDELQEARAQFERALRLRSLAFDGEHVLVARSLERLGAVERLLGRADAARTHLRAAIAIQEHAPAVSRLELATSLRELALLAESEGHAAEALEVAVRAEAISREQFQRSSGGLAERDALAQARVRERGLDLALSLAVALEGEGRLDPGEAARVFDAVIRSRALVLDALASRERVAGVHPDPRTAALLDDLHRSRSRWTLATVDGAALGSENVGDTLRDTEGAAATAERALAARSPEFREELARQRTGLSELCAALPEDSALLSFVRYREETAAAGARGRERYAAFVLRAGAAAPRLFALGAATDLDDAVEAWQERVATDPRLQRATDPVATYRLVAGRLADRLWRPFAYELRGAVQVFVTRDGSIQSVSFATLPTVDGDYLVSSGPTVSYLGAERDLVAPAIGDTRADGLLAIGDPAFGGPVPGARECDPTERFDPLPGAKDEVMEIASRWPATERTVVLTGAAADASTVRRLAPSYGVLHLATHAFQRVGSCGDGETNPLRRSGLALAGANRGARASEPSGRGDGVLTAEDVALLDLHKVEWAVLSACASGRGSIEAGEGILGLERAFRIAGVRNVIASLWAVEDDATRSWMRELYAARRDGAPAAEAVRHASLSVLARQRRSGGTTHPYAWGSFIVVGDGR